MNVTNPVRPGSLPTRPATGTQAQLAKSVQSFEGVLWSEVADLMLSTQLGPTGLGYAGSTYQRMMWHMITQSDFGTVDQSLTQATLKQLAGSGSAEPATTTRALLARSAPSPASTQPSATTPPFTTPVRPGAATPGVSTPTAATSPAVTVNSALDWARQVWNHIAAAAEALKVPANALLAQSALETDWGHDASGHNLFGIKSQGSEPGFAARTREYVDGALQETTATFRRYASDAKAALDYVATIRSRHPNVVGQPTVADFAQALQASGYATDPQYAAKIVAVADSPRMRSLLQAVQETPAATNSLTVQPR